MRLPVFRRSLPRRTARSAETFAQCWSLDAPGNWKGFRQDDNGDGSWDLVQSRSANPVNEITGITNNVGSAWVMPAYSPAGNMAKMPALYKNIACSWSGDLRHG
jgi:hypothetical protein